MAKPLTAVPALPRRLPPLAKIAPPQVGALLPRERLFTQLDALAATPMLWLAAPPGAGKTSLVASWLRSRQRLTLWLQLDAADADPAAFFHYLGMAARALVPQGPPWPLFTPDDARQPLLFARRHLRALFQALPPHTTLVFDNAQDAGAESLLPELLALLVEEQPPQLLAIVVSRHDPPAALARARAARRVALLDAQELRFLRDEAGAMAARSGITAGALVDRVLDRSQGWAAGIVLLLESVRRQAALGDAALAGGLETVFDYFASQVFDANPPEVQQTLLRLSVLPRMTAAMAVELSGDASAGDLLDDLARRHLFTDRRFAPTPSYQFHALFRGFLQARAKRRLGAEEQLAALLRAAQLLHAAGDDDGAMALCLQAQAWPDAAQLVLSCAESLVAAGRHQTLAEWIAALPPAQRAADPWLRYWLGVVRSGTDPDDSRAQLDSALTQFDRLGERGGQVLSLAALLGSWWNESDNVRWLEPYSARLVTLLDDGAELSLQTRATGLVRLTLARLMIRPSDPALASWAQRLAALPLEDLPATLALAAGTCLLEFHWGVGDTDACEAVVRRTRPFAERADLPPGERMWFWFWLMTHRVYMADAPGAREAMAQARELNDLARRAPPWLDFLRWDVTLELQQGHVREARAKLSRDLEPQLPQASRFTQACIDLEWVRCANEERRYAEAIERGQRAMRVCAAAGHDWLQVVLGLSVCCAQALSGEIDEGLLTLGELRRFTAQALPLMTASVDAYEALLQLRSGASDAARAALDSAMALRGHTAYVWGPGWNRPAIAALAAFALGEGWHVAAMTRFVRGLRLAPPAPDLQAWPWPVRMQVLDGFTVTIDGDAQALRRRKSPHRLLELLKALVGMGGHEVPSTWLCDAVWPDAEGDAARRSLETSLSRLRKLLGSDDALQLRAGKVSLDASRVWLDLTAFAYRLRGLADIESDTPAWAEQAQRSLALYRRPLLSGELDAAWLVGERERWRQRWLGTVDKLVAYHGQRGERDALQQLLDDAQPVDDERSVVATLASLRSRWLAG